ncbi:hypothetical protein L3Q82_011067 [Scortum barcoo]|uniref:Uncharacterized protein n=1 Tax=Scortum barcoo TaxID=214431 RepID=A0ACB8WAG9_9TELE|nr:hypothetical protein L3Q82_011067 [Scortum barcoo]
MSPHRNSWLSVLLVFNIFPAVSVGGVNLTASESAGRPEQSPSLSPAALLVNPPVLKPAPDSLLSVNLLSSFPEDLEISDYCLDLLRVFGQRYVASVNCLVPAARPVKVCQNCFSSYSSLQDIYTNISSDQMGPGNVSCRDSLLRSDRLMLVFLLYSSLEDVWKISNCDNCIAKGFQSLTNDTLYYMANLNQTLTCFEKGTIQKLCKNCKSTYKDLNELYGRMERNQTMCIDIEDAMNMTRKLWSKQFSCSFPREETVPVIAVSSFMLFLPIIFYLSSFLHSEQKKRKLIHLHILLLVLLLVTGVSHCLKLHRVSWVHFLGACCASAWFLHTAPALVLRVSTLGGHADPDVEFKCFSMNINCPLLCKIITPQRIINLQRDLLTLVTNIQTAADAKESMQRTELEEARRLRLERLESDLKSSQEKFEEITRGWSIAKQKVIHQELQEALNKQQQLCAALIENKKKLINDLQQELKVGDDRYVKDLRKQAEELDLVMERMVDQIKILTKAYREELAQMERIYEQECDVLLTRDKTEWEQHMKELLDKELERLTQRQKKVEEYETTIHNLMLQTSEEYNLVHIRHNEKFQVLEREHQRLKGSVISMTINKEKKDSEVHQGKFILGQIKRRLMRLSGEIKNLQSKYTNQQKQLTTRSHLLSKDYKRSIQQYERVKKKVKYFPAANVRKFEEMWQMIEAEVKQLVEKALLIDSLICKQHLDISWERPPMAFTGLSGPNHQQKRTWRPPHQAVSQLFQSGQTSQYSQRVMDASVGPLLETDTENTDTDGGGAAVQSESGAEVEEGTFSMETLKKVMELLCDEAGFLLEDKLLNLLAPLEKDEQTVMKLSSLLCAFGIREEDLPKLVHFLFKYKHQKREQSEDVCVDSGGSSDGAVEVKADSPAHLTTELIDPNTVVPALKSFLEQLMRSRESSARQHHSFQHVEARDASEDEAYWESMSNVISEDKLKLWDTAENTFKQYHAVLTEISELIPETQSLEKQNRELRMLLQQSSQLKSMSVSLSYSRMDSPDTEC